MQVPFDSRSSLALLLRDQGEDSNLSIIFFTTRAVDSAESTICIVSGTIRRSSGAISG